MTDTGSDKDPSKHWLRISSTRQLCLVASVVIGVATVGCAGDAAADINGARDMLPWLGMVWSLLCAATVLPIRVPILDEWLDTYFEAVDRYCEAVARSLRPRRRSRRIEEVERLAHMRHDREIAEVLRQRPPTGDPELDRKLEGLGIYPLYDVATEYGPSRTSRR
jgi:hypothetical protein